MQTRRRFGLCGVGYADTAKNAKRLAYSKTPVRDAIYWGVDARAAAESGAALGKAFSLESVECISWGAAPGYVGMPRWGGTERTSYASES